MKTQSVEIELFQADRQDEANCCLSQLCKCA